MPSDKKENQLDADHEGRQAYEMDIDRMVNEGLGGGQVTRDNGLIEETTTSTMKGDQHVPESGLDRDDL